MEYIVTEKNGAGIQKMIGMAAAAGGGKVSLEPGIYPSGTLYLRSNVELHVPAGAVILGHPKPEMYDDFRHSGFDSVTPEGSRKCLIACADCENVAITGHGIINGQGPHFYDTNVKPGAFFAKPPYPRPRMVQFYHCRNVFFEDITLLDSPGWTCWLIDCEDVRISRIRIEGCQQMINNDGIDIDSCRNVTVSNSFFRTGDDCLILRAIRRSPDTPSICENVLVCNCVLDSACQGIRIGCPSDDTIRNCKFSSLVLRCCNGILSYHPYTYLRKNCTGYLHIHDITFDNLDIEAESYPVRIGNDEGITLRGIERLSFRDLRIRGGKPICLIGRAPVALNDIILQNISGTIENGIPVSICNVRNLKMDNVRLTGVTTGPGVFCREESPSWEAKF